MIRSEMFEFSQFKTRVESAFYSLGLWIYKHCWITLIGTLLFACLMISHILNLRMDTSFEGYFSKTSLQFQTYEAFKKEFVQDKVALIHIHPPDVFDLTFLEKLRTFHTTLETTIPHLENVFSLINIPAVKTEEGEIQVEELMKTWPETPEELAVLKKRVMENPIYQTYFVDKAGQSILIAVEPNIDLSQKPLDLQQKLKHLAALDIDALTDSPNRQFVRAIKTLVQQFQSKDFSLQVSGLSVLEQNFEEKLQEDSIQLTLLLVGILALLSAILFRRPAGVILPLLVVGFALFSTLGAMAFFYVPIATISVLLPLIILATGIGDSVHFLTFFFQQYGDTGDRQKSIAYALEHSGAAMTMTSITTAGGLLSFISVNFIHVVALGIFGALGVLLALLYTIFLLPALLSVVPLARREPQNSTSMLFPGLEKLAEKVGIFAYHHPWRIVIFCSVICCIAIVGILQLNFSFHVLNWFPPEDEFRRAAQAVDHTMKGSVNLDVIIDTGKEDGVYNPELIRRLDEANHLIKEIDVVAQSTSVVDILKQIHHALNADQHSILPESAGLIAKELLIFESGSAGNLERLVNFNASKVRINIRVPWVDVSVYANQFQETLVPKLHDIFSHFGTITTTGLGILFLSAFHLLLGDMVQSYTIALVVITLLMIFFTGHLKLGFLSMIPNVFPIVIGLGMMGALKMPFDAVAIVMACIALGIVVDDTVHFLFHFERFLSQENDVQEALRRTLTNVARAMVFTSLMLAGGFFIFSMAYIKYLSNFGIITGIITLAAVLSDLILMPALVTLMYRKRG